MNQGKSKVSYGKNWYEIWTINGLNILNVILGNNTRYYVSEQCIHLITTQKYEHHASCSKFCIGLDGTALIIQNRCA